MQAEQPACRPVLVFSPNGVVGINQANEQKVPTWSRLCSLVNRCVEGRGVGLVEVPHYGSFDQSK